MSDTRQVTCRQPDERHVGYVAVPTDAVQSVLPPGEELIFLPHDNKAVKPSFYEAQQQAGRNGFVASVCQLRQTSDDPAAALSSPSQRLRVYKVDQITVDTSAPYDTWTDRVFE